MEDTAILELLYQHSEDGLRELKDQYEPLLFSISSGVVRDRSDAEECVNDTYLKIWNVIPPYKPPHFRSFLCKIARQIAIDKYRHNHKKSEGTEYMVSLSEFEEDFPDLGPCEIEDRELTEEVNGFVAALDIESKTLFVRRYFFFESPKALAERFELSEDNVNVKLHRIRNKLKKYLEERGYHFEQRKTC